MRRRRAVDQLHDPGVDLVLGSYGSTISAPAAEAAARRGMLFWETGAVGDMTGPGAGDLVFRVAPTGGVLGRAAIAFIAEELAPELDRDPSTLRFAVAYVDDVYGQSVAAGAEARSRSRAHRRRHVPLRLRTRRHGEARRTRIAAAEPDVLFVSAYLDDAIALRREIVAPARIWWRTSGRPRAIACRSSARRSGRTRSGCSPRTSRPPP